MRSSYLPPFSRVMCQRSMRGSEESYRFTQHGYSIEQGSCLPRQYLLIYIQMDLLGFTGVADLNEDNSSERQGQSVSPRSVHFFMTASIRKDANWSSPSQEWYVKLPVPVAWIRATQRTHAC